MHNLGTLNSRICFRVRVARLTRADFRSLVMSLLLLLLLRFLSANILAGILDTLALVRLRWSVCSNLRRSLPYSLFVSPPHDNPSLARSLNEYILGTPILDRVRKSQRQIQNTTLHSSPISHPYELQLLLEAIADTRHHVRYQRSSGSRLRKPTGCITSGPACHNSVLLGHVDGCMNTHPKLTSWPLYRNFSRPNCYIHASGNTDRHLRDS